MLYSATVLSSADYTCSRWSVCGTAAQMIFTVITFVHHCGMHFNSEAFSSSGILFVCGEFPLRRITIKSLLSECCLPPFIINASSDFSHCFSFLSCYCKKSNSSLRFHFSFLCNIGELLLLLCIQPHHLS